MPSCAPAEPCPPHLLTTKPARHLPPTCSQRARPFQAAGAACAGGCHCAAHSVAGHPRWARAWCAGALPRAAGPPAAARELGGVSGALWGLLLLPTAAHVAEDTCASYNLPLSVALWAYASGADAGRSSTAARLLLTGLRRLPACCPAKPARARPADPACCRSCLVGGRSLGPPCCAAPASCSWVSTWCVCACCCWC